MKRIIDTTLREGEQAPGVCFKLAERLALVAALAAIGVDEIELGHGVGDSEMPRLLAAARRTAPGLPVALWVRAAQADIATAAALRPDRLSLSLPVSDLHMARRLGKSRRWLLGQVGRAARRARALGVPWVGLGLEDATRADPAFLVEVLHACRDAELNRVRLADTVGIASPATMARLVQLARPLVDGELAVHCHNDFGMGTANAVAAWEAGADAADGTLLGLGERSGLAATEQLVAWLAVTGEAGRYQTDLLPAVCADVARLAGRNVPPQQPVVGTEIFVTESGLHIDGLLKDHRTYEPYEPGVVGRQHSWRLGQHAGRRAVAARLAQLGLAQLGTAPRGAAHAGDDLAGRVREAARTLGRALTDDELLALAQGRGGGPARPSASAAG